MKPQYNTIIIYIHVALVLWVLITLEPRSVKKIKKEAKKRNYSIESIRSPKKDDGENPFSNFSFFFGRSSILGIKGEHNMDKIVIFQKDQNKYTYWVRVKSVFFVPYKVIWKLKE